MSRHTTTTAHKKGQEAWLQALRKTLREPNNGNAREALRKLEIVGCTQANLFGFLYGFHWAQALVFGDRTRARDRALSGLASVVGRLTRSADALEGVLKISMSGEEELRDWLRERLTLTLVQERREAARAHFSPDRVLDLPQLLRERANEIGWVLSELRRELSARKVKDSVYLVQLVTYVAEVTGEEPPWNTIAELTDVSAIAAGSSRGQFEPGLLRKNCISFKKRNPDLYNEICSKMKDYVSHCRQLPAGDKKPTFYSWNRARRPSES
jgi:hypothetical protein